MTATPPATGQTAGVNGNPANPNTPPAVGLQATTPEGVLPGQNTATTSTTGIGTGTAANNAQFGAGGTQIVSQPAAIGARTSLALNNLPATVQSSIASQLPPGSQLMGVVAENTAAGTMLRAQIMQNGIASEIPLSGVPTSLIPGTTFNGPAFASTTQNGLADTSSGYVVASPFAYDDLPAGVQSSFKAQATNAPISELTYTPASNGGIYRGMANGQPIEVRVLSNGQLLGNARFAATAATNNDLKISEIPKAVRDSLRKSGVTSEVTRINRSTGPAGTSYDVLTRNGDRTSFLQIAADGTVIRNEQLWPRTLAAKTPEVIAIETPKPAWSTLPVAVREAIEVAADPKTVRSMVLTNFEGKTAYAVEWIDQNAMRDRIYVGKDGLVLNTATNLNRITVSGQEVAFDDLPIAARAVVEEQGNPSTITQINLAMRGATPVYIVSYRQDGELQQMLVTREGLRMDNAAGAPAITVTGQAVEK